MAQQHDNLPWIFHGGPRPLSIQITSEGQICIPWSWCGHYTIHACAKLKVINVMHQGRCTRARRILTRNFDLNIMLQDVLKFGQRLRGSLGWDIAWHLDLQDFYAGLKERLDGIRQSRRHCGSATTIRSCISESALAQLWPILCPMELSVARSYFLSILIL